MSSSSAPPPPNYEPIAQAQMASAATSAQTAKDQLDWAKSTYADNKATTDKVVDRFLQTQDTNDKTAAKDRARYESIYQPLEGKLAADADSYSSPERKDLERGRAEANVGQQFDAARTNSQRELESFGINPGATRYAALDIGARAQEAATKAAAANQSDLAVDATGRALRSEAINVGRGYPGQIAGQYSTAQGAGTGAVNSDLATTASGANTMGTGVQWTGAANNSLNGATNTLNTGYNNSMAQFNANQQSSSGVGSALGLLGGIGMTAMGLPVAGGGSIGGNFLNRFADGGEIPTDMPGDGSAPAPTHGEAVPVSASPSGGRALDDVNAKVTSGEFIVPKQAVQYLGTKHFYNLIDKAKKDEQESKQRSGAIPHVRPAAMQRRPSPAGRHAALQVH